MVWPGRDCVLVYQLCVALATVALLSVWPALDQLSAHLRAVNGQPLDRWVALVLVIGIVQLAYVVYLVQLPDWSTVWMATLTHAAITFGYALILGVSCADALGWSTLGAQEYGLASYLGFADEMYSRRAIPWSATMLCLFGLLTYGCGRTALCWTKRFQAALALRKTGLS